jgi:Outer membrane lipoprotein-sorting protein
MKTLKLAAFFIIAALSLTSVKAQTADEIINKHVEAIGGAENWRKVTSMIQTGTMSIQGMSLEVVNTILHKKGMRSDITLMGMTNYQIMTPTEGWKFFPAQGQQAPEPVTADEVKEGQDGLDAQGVLVDYKAKGHTAEFLGKEDVDGTECYKLKLTSAAGKSTTYFIDAAKYYNIKTVTTAKANGQEAELTTTMSNYQKTAEGLVVPMSITIPFSPAMSLEFIVSKVEFNKPVDESIFKVSK